jgi:transcriptional regulator with XRE-family HTH domain
MPKWKPGECGRPPVRKWSEDEIRAFQRDLRAFRESLGYSEKDLADALGYIPQYIKELEGQYGRLRQPSARFQGFLAEFKATNPQPKKPWITHVAEVLKADVVPLGRIDAQRRQCPECLAQVTEGLMEEAEAWFWPGHPRAVWCRAHRQAGPRRRRWFARCRELGCSHVTPVPGTNLHTCVGGNPCLRSKPWAPLTGERSRKARRRIRREVQ